MFIKHLFFIFCFCFVNTQLVEAQINSTSQTGESKSDPSITDQRNDEAQTGESKSDPSITDQGSNEAQTSESKSDPSITDQGSDEAQTGESKSDPSITDQGSDEAQTGESKSDSSITDQRNDEAQTSVSRSNPSISVNALMLGRAGNKGNNATSENPNGFQFQELETRFTSNIDAYFRGDITLAVEREDGEFIVEPEEVFIETLSLPSFTIKAGKFYALLGRHNHLHTHSFPFIDKPLTNEILLGEEGLNEMGLAVSYLMPTSWYFEIVGQVFSATNETLFNSSTQNDVAGVLFIKNLWDLSDASTFEFDLGYGNGKNSFDGTTHLYSASITYRWRPIERSMNKSFLWTTEFLQSHRENAIEDVRVGGISSWIQWQFARRWWLQGRVGYLGLPEQDIGATRKYSVLVGFVPTEYSALRLQYDHINRDFEEGEHRVSLQLNVALGAHPAHNY